METRRLAKNAGFNLIFQACRVAAVTRTIFSAISVVDYIEPWLDAPSELFVG